MKMIVYKSIRQINCQGIFHNSLAYINFNKTVTPVARMEMIRPILALAAQSAFQIYQFDVKPTFLNGELKQKVYAQQP